MPSVIADTSPLRYLHQIGYLELLADFYRLVIVPYAVVAELRDGMQLGFNVPNMGQLCWAKVEGTLATPDIRVSLGLGSGERDVLCTALQTPDPLVILDDADAREDTRNPLHKNFGCLDQGSAGQSCLGVASIAESTATIGLLFKRLRSRSSTRYRGRMIVTQSLETYLKMGRWLNFSELKETIRPMTLRVSDDIEVPLR